MLFIKIGCYLKVYILDVENNEEIRIVFFGKMGVGKSVFGNIIFGDNMFVLKVLVLFIISCCVYNLLYWFGYKIVIVDMFGIFDILFENYYI